MEDSCGKEEFICSQLPLPCLQKILQFSALFSLVLCGSFTSYTRRCFNGLEVYPVIVLKHCGTSLWS